MGISRNTKRKQARKGGKEGGKENTITITDGGEREEGQVKKRGGSFAGFVKRAGGE